MDAARREIPSLAARMAKLEADLSSTDLTALSGPIDKVESALSAPKAATRVAPEKPAASENPAAVAIVTDAIRDKLASGSSYATEIAALTALGVEPAQLAPLKALAGGAPTNSALAASFAAAEPKVLAAAVPREPGGIGDRFLAHLRGLVQVRYLGETAGEIRRRWPRRSSPASGRATSLARSRISPGFPTPRGRRAPLGTPKPNGNKRRSPPCRRSAKPRSRGWLRAPSPESVDRIAAPWQGSGAPGRKVGDAMFRLLIVLAGVALAAWGLMWFADNPGLVTLTWRGVEYKVSMMVAIGLVAAVGDRLVNRLGGAALCFPRFRR